MSTEAATAGSGVSDSLADAAAGVSRSVVEVRTRGHGAGAGTIWTADGTIVTNHHVAPGEQAEIVLPDGRELAATATARDVENDLAVLRVRAEGLPAVHVGDARRLRPGDVVFAVGHPFGVRHALTAGIVTTAPSGRPRRGERELVRASVRLLPGNSGGPMVDAHGRVVGINSMVAGGLALAVPSHLVQRLLGAGHAPRVLGVQVRVAELPAAYRSAAGGAERAVLVSGVAEGSVAEEAGLLAGDLLLAFDGASLHSTDALLGALGSAGDDARLLLLRGGRPLQVELRFGTERAQRAA